LRGNSGGNRCRLRIATQPLREFSHKNGAKIPTEISPNDFHIQCARLAGYHVFETALVPHVLEFLRRIQM
jgi:hypothetical protein